MTDVDGFSCQYTHLFVSIVLVWLLVRRANDCRWEHRWLLWRLCMLFDGGVWRLMRDRLGHGEFKKNCYIHFLFLCFIEEMIVLESRGGGYICPISHIGPDLNPSLLWHTCVPGQRLWPHRPPKYEFLHLACIYKQPKGISRGLTCCSKFKKIYIYFFYQ